MQFNKIKLKDIADINMGQSPNGSSYNNNGRGIPFLQGNKTFGFLYPTIDTWTTEPKKIGKKNSVLMSVRAPVGDMNIANKDICIGRGLCSIEMKNGNNQYLYYLLKNSIKKIKMKSTGTVFDSINRKELENIEILNFDKSQQKKISKVLFDIDKKIELNIQTNDNLYELSSSLYKKWYDSLSSDNITTLSKFDEMGKIVMGQSPKGESYNYYNEGLPLINGAADYENGFLKAQKYTTMPTKTCNKNDLIFCIRATIGLLTICDKEYCLGRGVAGIVNINELYREYVFHLINSSIESFKNLATGSVIVGISRNDIQNIEVKIPSKEQIKNFHDIQKKLFDKMENIRQENIVLTQLRDTLLPKLMSGKIDLDKIEI